MWATRLALMCATLLARMRAVLRRSSGIPASQEQSILQVEELELNRSARTVFQGDKRIELTDVEFSLLEVLMGAPGKVVSREEISEKVLGRKFHPFDRALDMHVSRLRRKLNEAGIQEDQVKTIRGAGYQLAVQRDRQLAKD